mgnify:CR=1 FL=1
MCSRSHTVSCTWSFAEEFVIWVLFPMVASWGKAVLFDENPLVVEEVLAGVCGVGGVEVELLREEERTVEEEIYDRKDCWGSCFLTVELRLRFT